MMDPILITIIILAITGAVIGFASGFLGVGGGFLMVPVQFWLLTSLGTDPTLAIRIAFATSLAVVIPTALSGAWGHYCRKCVLLRPLMLMAIPAILGAVAGATVSTHEPGALMKVLFGVLIVIVAVTMFIIRAPPESRPIPENGWLFVLCGFAFGGISGLLGIGGGIVMVPVMIMVLRFSILEAIGTSTALMLCSSAGGVVTYIMNGLAVPGLPPYSLGYVNVLQWFVLAAASVPMAQVGVRTVHRAPPETVKIVFMIVMAVTGFHMIGIF
jgi:uncharacterized protein